MDAIANEFGLVLTLVLNGTLFACAWRLASRRGSGGALQAACDSFLLYFTVQYVAVALPGALSVFNLWTMSAVAVVASGIMWAAAGQRVDLPDTDVIPKWSLDHLTLLACATFVVVYCGTHFYDHRYNPPIATDALVYHLPTAVQWIQTGSLGLYPTWYWNPAATYSPATSSTFMAWWMFPVRNDVLVRFVHATALA